MGWKTWGFRAFALLSLGWLGFMLWGCLDETTQSSGLIARFWPWLAVQPYADKVAHAGIHAILASCLWLAGQCWARVHQRRWNWSASATVLALCFAIGACIEVLQHFFTLTRNGDVTDAVANALGALLAISVWEVALRAWRLLRRH